MNEPKNSKKGIKQIIDDYVQVKFGTSLSGMGISTIIILILGGLYILEVCFSPTEKLYKFFTNPDSTKTENPPDAHAQGNLPPSSFQKGEVEGVQTHSYTWQRYLGTPVVDSSSPHRLHLKEKEKAVSIQRVEPVEEKEVLNFSVVPVEGNVVNFVVGLLNATGDLYNVVIGDGDINVVSLKASNSLGGDMSAIKEVSKGTVRPRLDHQIKPGTEMGITIDVQEREENKKSLRIDIRYVTNQTGDDIVLTQSFHYDFIASPGWKSAKKILTLGLIKGLHLRTGDIIFNEPQIDLTNI